MQTMRNIAVVNTNSCLFSWFYVNQAISIKLQNSSGLNTWAGLVHEWLLTSVLFPWKSEEIVNIREVINLFVLRQTPISRNILLPLSRNYVRVRLHQASASRLRPLCDDASDSVLIEINGDTWKWVANPFWSDSTVVNENRIASIIVALTLTLGVNGPLMRGGFRSLTKLNGSNEVLRMPRLYSNGLNYIIVLLLFTDYLSVKDPGFPRRGAPTPEFGAKTYYLVRFLPESAWKWKKLYKL